jgi:hypothetical protein
MARRCELISGQKPVNGLAEPFAGFFLLSITPDNKKGSGGSDIVLL